MSIDLVMCAIASKLTLAKTPLMPPAGRLMPHCAKLHAQGWLLSLPAACMLGRDSTFHTFNGPTHACD